MQPFANHLVSINALLANHLVVLDTPLFNAVGMSGAQWVTRILLTLHLYSKLVVFISLSAHHVITCNHIFLPLQTPSIVTVKICSLN